MAPELMSVVLMMVPVSMAVKAAPAPPVDEKAEAEARLDAVLREWARASDAVQESHFTVRITDLDQTIDVKHCSTAEVFIKKPDLMRLDFRKQDGSLDHSFVYKEGEIHEFDAAHRTETIYELSSDFGFPGQPERYPDGLFQGVLRGMLVERHSWIAAGPPLWRLTTHFDIQLSAQDENWTCLEIKPRAGKYKEQIKRMQVVLDRKNLRMRRLWIESTGSTEWTVEYEKPNGGSEEAVTPESLMKGLPDDWKKVDLRGHPGGQLRPLPDPFLKDADISR